MAAAATSLNQSDDTSLLSLSYAIAGGEEVGSLLTADQVTKNHNFSKVLGSSKALENARRQVTEELPTGGGGNPH